MYSSPKVPMVKHPAGLETTNLLRDVPSIAEEDRDQIVRIHAHTGLGDVTVRIGNRPRTTGATYRSE